MKNLIALLIVSAFVFFTSSPTFGQCKNAVASIPTLDSAYVASKTTYFTIESNKMIGAGMDKMKQIISESQFVVLGERHGSSQISHLTKAMIPMLSQSGYDNFAVEVGPDSGRKLMEFCQSPKDTRQRLYEFNSQYYFKELDDTPIPFFWSVEDAEFLQAAAEHKMELWGLDQEYFNSIIYQTDELLKMAQGKSNFEEIQKMKTAADQFIREWFIKEDNSEEDIDIFGIILKDENVINFFAQFDESTPEALQLIENLKISWDIYSRWRKGSHADRVKYIRSNFMKHYSAKAKTKKRPKVFFKFGGVHASQALSLGCYDIGHLANELAAKNATQCANITISQRYYEEEGVVSDLLPKAVFLQRMEAFIKQGNQEQFALINLEEIRNDIEKGLIQLPTDDTKEAQEYLLEAFDFYIILPTDKTPTPNYKE